VHPRRAQAGGDRVGRSSGAARDVRRPERDGGERDARRSRLEGRRDGGADLARPGPLPDSGGGGRQAAHRRAGDRASRRRSGDAMKTKEPGMRGGTALGLALFLAGVPLVAHAEPNVVTQVVARADGARTIVTVHGTATPSFTAYRLERPSRVVVDLADGRLATADGPIDVDTWAVGQIATAQYSGDASRTARVMIGFKRAASYDVRAKGHDVIIPVTPDEKPPADVLADERHR